MGILDAAYNEIHRGTPIKREDPLIKFQEVSGTDYEQAQAFYVINTIARGSKIGRSLLEKAAADGYKIKMNYVAGAGAVCNSEAKVIVLNPAFSEETMISSMVHEARHAEQNKNATWTGSRGDFSIETELMLSRAMEADAQSVAAAACFEIFATTGNSGPLTEMRLTDPHIVLPMESALKNVKSPVTAEVLKAGFNGWFEHTSTVETYEKCYQVAKMNYANGTGDYSRAMFGKTLTSEQIVSAFCIDPEGKCYFEDDKTVLKDREKCAVSEGTMAEFEKFFTLRRERTGMPADESFTTLKIRDGKRGFKNKINDLKRAFSQEYRQTAKRDKSDEIGLTKEGGSSDVRRINHLINDLSADKSDRLLLTELKTSGYTIAFENAMRKPSVRDERAKMILLNPALKDDALKNALKEQCGLLAARKKAFAKKLQTSLSK